MHALAHYHMTLERFGCVASLVIGNRQWRSQGGKALGVRGLGLGLGTELRVFEYVVPIRGCGYVRLTE